jgi:hypothetical protein
MRIWDISPGRLCDRHLLAEHRELHAIWVIITAGREGYSRHPETMRWRGKLRALHLRHERLVKEFSHRVFEHRSPLDSSLAVGGSRQDAYVDSPREQVRILRGKKCGCRVQSSKTARAR